MLLAQGDAALGLLDVTLQAFTNRALAIGNSRSQVAASLPVLTALPAMLQGL